MSITWDRWVVEIEVYNRIVGGIPLIPDDPEIKSKMIDSWLKGQDVDNLEINPETGEPFEVTLAEKLKEDPDVPVKLEDISGLETGFKRDNTSMYIEARLFKANIRESAQRLGILVKKRGSRQVIQHDIHVSSTECDKDQKIRPYDRDGNVILRPTGKDQRPISVMTRQGPRTAIKRFEYLSEKAHLTYVVRVLSGGVGNGIVGEKELEEILMLGEDLGIGSDRSQGEGTYIVKRFEPFQRD